jgi:hypothetical protein
VSIKRLNNSAWPITLLLSAWSPRIEKHNGAAVLPTASGTTYWYAAGITQYSYMCGTKWGNAADIPFTSARSAPGKNTNKKIGSRQKVYCYLGSPRTRFWFIRALTFSLGISKLSLTVELITGSILAPWFTRIYLYLWLMARFCPEYSR